jgi:hypothetical protein
VVAIAALVVSIIALAVSTLLVIRQQRFERRVVAEEQRDRKEALALQRHSLQYDEGGWRRWGRRPEPPGS